MDVDDEVESVGWVQRTGEVSLNEGADTHDAALANAYNAVLGAFHQMCHS